MNKPPKFFLKSANASGDIDPTTYALILDQIPGRVTDEAQADYLIVPVSNHPNYQFNPALLRNKRPVVLIDFLEYEHCAAGEMSSTHLFGVNTHSNRWLCNNPGWLRLDEWAQFNQQHIVVYFKRELFLKDRSDTVLPIEWPAKLSPSALQSKTEFDARPFEVFNCWGYSSPVRPELHGRIIQAMARDNLDVVTDWRQFTGLPESTQKRWVSIYSPYWTREPMERVMDAQRQSKVSISLPGAGIKCFRSTQSPVDSIMAMHHDSMAWSYPWTHGKNCIRLLPGHEFDDLQAALSGQYLYDIYQESQETCRLYASKTYANEYVLKKITERL